MTRRSIRTAAALAIVRIALAIRPPLPITRPRSPSTINIDEEHARHWLEHGAQPSETVATLLRTKGIKATGS